MSQNSSSSFLSRLVPLPLFATAFVFGACGGSGSSSGTPSDNTVTGQSDFESAPPYGASNGSASASSGGGTPATAAGATNAGAAPAPAKAADTSGTQTVSQPRTVQETDLYRLDGNRLYYLNQYRGLMVFDVTNVDHPVLLGRSAIFGTPVQMFVNNGIAIVVVADWYGVLDTGKPFHGSIVRGLDATDPTNIKVLGEAKLGGWVEDTRIVGNVLYAVSEDQGWAYGWATPGFVGLPVAGGGGVANGAGVAGVGVAVPARTVGSPGGSDVIVSSVNFAGGQIQQVSSRTYSGYGGMFNVTPTAIMLAHPVAAAQTNLPPPGKTALQYLDITDPNGAIVERGSMQVDGTIQNGGADNGRWNLDYSDTGKIAHVIGCASSGCGAGYILGSADFNKPDAPVSLPPLAIPSTGWSAAARFDSNRMYLSPGYTYTTNAGTTPLQIYDLSNPAAPVLAGQTQMPGRVWLMIPSGTQLFALGQNNINGVGGSSSQVSLNYLDVTNAAAPTLIGTSSFGDGWAWTPAASTFKAFTKDPTQGLVVLPFSGWSSSYQKYNNGVQLIEFTPTTISTAGAAHTKGYVERGIFANGRILSMSDLALSVVDYRDPLAPTVTAELTLARNVIAAQPAGSTIAQISSDWFGNDLAQSEVRALPISDAAENFDESQAPDVTVVGAGARVYTNPVANFAYVTTSVQVTVPCPQVGGTVGGKPGVGVAPAPGGGLPVQPAQCTEQQQVVSVVDVSGGTAAVRGTLALPIDPNGYYYAGGWRGFYAWDWYGGDDIVQVGNDALAFRRYHANYSPNGQYIHESSDLYIVDLSNPDKPTVASVVITNDPNGWWGNMKVIGNTLYATHYVSPIGNVQNPKVRYYLDAVDLRDRQNPRVLAPINVPGMLVGGSQTDPSILYTVDYQWDPSVSSPINEFEAVKIHNGRAYLQSRTSLSGWVGTVYVRGSTAYTTLQKYVYTSKEPGVELHQIDLSDPKKPVDSVASGPDGWGWIVDVQGDRLLVESGWGNGSDAPGLDIYRLTPNAPPAYDQFVRTNGWSLDSTARQRDQIFLSSGYWGVQAVQLN
jgi:hypothetical protein